MVLDGAADRLTQLSPIKRALFELEEMSAKLHALEKERTEPIAIIGMGCRFPGGANSPAAYWQLLQAGVDAVTEVPAERWDANNYYDADPLAPGKMATRWGGFLENIDQFDPQFFGISPREATDLDPQHRLLLEVAWEALEHGGQATDKIAGSATGVFVGISNFDYGQVLMNQRPEELNAYLASGITHSTSAGRISYILGLRGPSLAVDTACSSSMVAIHLAIQSLRNRECEMALAGGVNIVLTPELLIGLSKAQMMASDGRCKTFDARADGFVRAEGCGMIVLKRLSDAEANGDHILAIIRGSAVNQDGRSNGMTAPNGPAQEDVIRKALTNGGIEPLDVGYIETHGTGTSLGDPIEVQALGDVFCQGRSQENPLLIGSVKTNLGHMEAAAGVASVIKVVLALQHGEIPAHLHFEQPNPHIPWAELAVDVPTKSTLFPTGQGRTIAGVSSFGFSGTNAHMILERVPEDDAPSTEVERPLHLLTLSAKDDVGLQELAGRYEEFLAQEGAAFADIAFTANVGRGQFSQRLALVAATGEEAQAQLKAYAAGEEESGVVIGTVLGVEAPKAVFLFTGQGSQYVGMGKELYETQPFFRQVLDECDALLKPYLEHSLLSVLFGKTEETKGLLDQTAYTQPALFALEYALAQLWQSWGVKPAAVMGHSVGEYVAACVAGVFSLADGLKLIAKRGQLMQSLPSGGAMAAFFASTEQVEPLLKGYENSLSIAAYNGPTNVVVSGAQGALDTLLAEATKQGIKSQRLTVSHAFHSPLMDSILDEFEKVAQGITYNAPQVPLYSNLTGTRSTGLDAAYWRAHLRQPVHFAKAIEELHSQGQALFLEIGPSPTLLGMARRCLPDEAKVSMLPSLRSGRAEWQQLLESLATLYVQGVEIDWLRFDQPYARRKVHLPTYPFQRQRYWVERTARRLVAQGPAVGVHPLLGQPLKIAGNQIVFETEISVEAFPFLAGHQVHGVPVFPAAGYIEMALAAARALLKAETAAVEELVMHKALALGEEGARSVQMVLAPVTTAGGTTKSYSFQLFSLATEEGAGNEWQLHVSGRVTVEPNGARQPDPLVADAVQARCGEQLSDENQVRQLLALDSIRGSGAELNVVEQLWRGETEALALITLPDSLLAEAETYRLHPALLDGALRMFGAVLAKGDGRYIPISVARVRLFGKPTQRVWSHLVISADDAATAQARTGDITLYDLTGLPIAQLEGLLVKRVAQDVAPRAEWLYQLEWQPQPLADQPAASLLTAEQIAPQLVSTLAQLQQERAWAQVQAIVPELEDLSTDYFVEALRQFGLGLSTGERG